MSIYGCVLGLAGLCIFGALLNGNTHFIPYILGGGAVLLLVVYILERISPTPPPSDPTPPYQPPKPPSVKDATRNSEPADFTQKPYTPPSPMDFTIRVANAKSGIREETVDVRRAPVSEVTEVSASHVFSAPEQRVRNEDFEIRDRVLIKYKGAESHVTVPEGVERIRQNAFTAIEKFMEWVGRPGDEGVVTFEEERPLKFIHEIDLPDSVTVIEEGALAQCENLERIRFGKNIREIKAFEFSRCTKLKQVVVSEETRIDERAFRKETEIIRAPKEVHNKCSNDGKGKTAGDFDVRTGVLVKYKGNESHVTVPDGVVAIGNNAFTVTERVKKHREALPPMLAEWSNREYETIEYWEDETVSNHNLKKITLPDSVLEIESYAFYKCSALKSIEFGKNICRIGRAAFQGCSNLKRVNVPDKAVIENYAFEKDTEIIRVPK